MEINEKTLWRCFFESFATRNQRKCGGLIQNRNKRNEPFKPTYVRYRVGENGFGSAGQISRCYAALPVFSRSGQMRSRLLYAALGGWTLQQWLHILFRNFALPIPQIPKEQKHQAGQWAAVPHPSCELWRKGHKAGGGCGQPGTSGQSDFTAEFIIHECFCKDRHDQSLKSVYHMMAAGDKSFRSLP